MTQHTSERIREGQLAARERAAATNDEIRARAVDSSDVIPVGATEIAERLDVKRTTVQQWTQRGLLPEPRWVVGGRPAWAWADVEQWARETGRLS